jgi:uncharacterized hydrophobic protein (TIGR00271 family)
MPPRRRIIVSDATLERLNAQAAPSPSYLVLMAMAGVLAAVALLTNSVPILIGSMVVAPALSPLELVAFALVGRRLRMAVHGMTTAVAGLLIAMAFAALTTWILNITGVIPPETNLLNKPLLEERVRPGWYSVFAAMAAGVAGTVAVIKEKTDALVGVVAALALIPAVAAAAIAFLSEAPLKGFDGLLLLGINIGFIIVTGALTLVLMRPEQKD